MPSFLAASTILAHSASEKVEDGASPGTTGLGLEVAVGGTGVAVGAVVTGVGVAGRGVVPGLGVGVGAMRVGVGVGGIGVGVAVGGMGVGVAGMGVAVGGRGVGVGVACAPHAVRTARTATKGSRTRKGDLSFRRMHT